MTSSNALLLGLSLNVLLISTRILRFSLAIVDTVTGQRRAWSVNGFISDALSLLQLLLFVGAAVNIITLFYAGNRRRRRVYQLFNTPVTTTIHSVNAKLIDRPTTYSTASTLSPRSYLDKLRSYFINTATSTTTSTTTTAARNDDSNKIWQLSVWTPEIKQLRLLCVFSPLHVYIMMYTLTPATLTTAMAQWVMLTLLLGLTVEHYNSLVNDLQVLHATSTKEYQSATKRQDTVSAYCRPVPGTTDRLIR
jgi:hypothetical protein